jgi:hypothetical protein
VPDAEITKDYEVVDGAPASVLDSATPNVARSIAIVVGDVAGFTLS